MTVAYFLPEALYSLILLWPIELLWVSHHMLGVFDWSHQGLDQSALVSILLFPAQKGYT